MEVKITIYAEVDTNLYLPRTIATEVWKGVEALDDVTIAVLQVHVDDITGKQLFCKE